MVTSNFLYVGLKMWFTPKWQFQDGWIVGRRIQKNVGL